MDIYGQGVIPNDWDGEYCCYAVLWPNSPMWLAVLRGAILAPSRGRFWDKNTGTITEAQAVIKETLDHNLHLEEVFMSCNDIGQLAEAINNISISLNNQANATLQTSGGCCDDQGSGGAPQIAPPFNPEIEGDPETDPPPAGFDTWEQFKAQKCAIAWDIIDTLASDLGIMIIKNWPSVGLSTIAAILAVTLATPIPFDDIIAICALVLSVGATVLLATALDIVNNNKGDLVCELYNGTSASDSRANFLLRWGQLVDGAPISSIVAFALKTLMGFMVGSAVVNRLYSLDSDNIWPVGPSDCSECGCDALFVNMENGGFLTEKLNDTDFRAVFNSTNNRWELTVAVNHNPDDHISFTDWQGPMMTIGYEVLSGSISGIPDPPSPVRFLDQSSNVLGGGSDPQPPTCFAWVIMVADNQFTVRFECISPC